MNVVDQILKLFDELDGFESNELIEALSERGYELKINYALEKEKNKNRYGIFLKSYDETKKIMCIKMCRNFGLDNKDKLNGFPNWGLRETKDFSEQKHRWDKEPIGWGKLSVMTSLHKELQRECGTDIIFEVRQLQ